MYTTSFRTVICIIFCIISQASSSLPSSSSSSSSSSLPSSLPSSSSPSSSSSSSSSVAIYAQARTLFEFRCSASGSFNPRRHGWRLTGVLPFVLELDADNPSFAGGGQSIRANNGVFTSCWLRRDSAHRKDTTHFRRVSLVVDAQRSSPCIW